MSIPAVAIIEWELLQLLHNSKGGLETDEAYKLLAEKFPQLTKQELTEPHNADEYGSRWKTAVRSVRNRLKDKGLISTNSRRGLWELTEAGHHAVTDEIDI